MRLPDPDESAKCSPFFGLEQWQQSEWIKTINKLSDSISELAAAINKQASGA